MKNVKIITLLCVIVLSFSATITISSMVHADELPPYMTYTASYMDMAYIDGNINDWYNYTEYYAEMYIMGESNSPIPLYFGFNYNESWLFGYVLVSNDYAPINALDIHFFGKLGQDDGIHIDYLHGSYIDLAFPDINDTSMEGPANDEDVGGFNDAEAIATSDGNWTLFEFMKALHSGDTAGKDIDLWEGNSIAVEFVAWIDIDPWYNPPNAALTPTYDDFRYIRLNIGYDGGDVLDIPIKMVNGPFMWTTSFDLAMTEETPFVNFDGVLSEDIWQRAYMTTVELQYFEWDTGFWDPSNIISADIMLVYDNDYLYGGINLYVPEYSPNNLWFGIAIGGYDWFYEDENGFDFIMFDYYSGVAEDMWMPSNHSEPYPDSFIGGYWDFVDYGLGFDGYNFQIEFQRPLAPNDPAGGDYNFYPGDTMYLAFVAAISSYGPPNYVDITPVQMDGYDEPALSIHPATLSHGGIEQPPVVEGISYNAPYIANPGIVLDGYDNETEWQNADSFSLTLQYNDFDDYENTTSPVDEINAVFKVFNDGQNIYIYAKFNVEMMDYDFVGILFCEESDIFSAPDGIDMMVIGHYGTEDLWFNGFDGADPAPDTDFGGSRDGEAVIIALSGETTVELIKPLDSGDTFDISVTSGDMLYFLPLVSYGNYGDYPNFFEIQYNSENMPSLVVHGLLISGEETSGTETDTSTDTENTLTIGFSLTDYFVLSVSFVGILSAVRFLRRKRK